MKGTREGTVEKIGRLSVLAKYRKRGPEKNHRPDPIVGMGLLMDKVREEEKYDGHYPIVTGELDMNDRDMREVYRGFAKIEDSFRATKTCLESRPIYVWLNEHIEAHFATCFLALVLVRLLEHKLANKYPAARILNSLKKYSCVHLDANNFQ